MNKLKAGGGAYGSAISIGLPILTQTAKSFIPEDSGKTGRVASAGLDAVTQIGSMAAMGSMFGPITWIFRCFLGSDEFSEILVQILKGRPQAQVDPKALLAIRFGGPALSGPTPTVQDRQIHHQPGW